MNLRTIRRTAAALLAVSVMQGVAMAHAFLDHAEPRVGWKTDASPREVKIWFSAPVEPAFSVVEVFAADGRQVDKKDTHGDPTDKTLLTVSIPVLPAGTYRVAWKVVATDTHKTRGEYKFTVKGA